MTYRRKCHCEGFDVPKQSLCPKELDCFGAKAPRNDRKGDSQLQRRERDSNWNNRGESREMISFAKEITREEENISS